MQALPQLSPNLLQLGCHALADGLTVYGEMACLVVRPADVGETQEVEGLRFPFPMLLPVLGGVAPKLDQARFLRVQFQPELRQPFPQLLQEPLGFFPVLETPARRRRRNAR